LTAMAALRKATKIDLLKSVPLFSECSKAELARIATLADEIAMPDGTVLIREGDVGREFFVIVEGTVRVTRKGRQLGDFGPGDYVGEVALVTGLPRVAGCVATSPVRLLVLSDSAFRGLISQSPSIAVKVLKSLGERLHAASI
jgi:CRP/FNR family cyclic AMP-dependent transcriptional regulator